MTRPLGPGLASAFLAGDWTEADLCRRGTRAIGGRRLPVWLRQLVAQTMRDYPEPPCDRPRELARYLGNQLSLRTPRARAASVHVHLPADTAMGPSRWPVTPLPDVASLARLLDLTDGELHWLADVRSLDRTAAQRLTHYRWRTAPTDSGGVRVLGAPKPLLRERQRRILRHCLDPVPVHPACHGFVRGRSVATYAQPHAGKQLLLHLDLEVFFASVPAARVFGVFRMIGYPEPVAHLLTGLVTTVLPRAVWRGIPSTGDPAHARLGRRLAAPHLPQGAPTSPAVANLVAHALDRRLTGLAKTFDAAYTRYADDLAFSLPRGAGALARAVGEIVADEGFRLNPRKSSIIPSSQRQLLTGLVVNDRPTPPREELDLLRAVLHRCATDGLGALGERLDVPDLQSHLLGRIAWVGVSRPDRTAALRSAYERISWFA